MGQEQQTSSPDFHRLGQSHTVHTRDVQGQDSGVKSSKIPLESLEKRSSHYTVLPKRNLPSRGILRKITSRRSEKGGIGEKSSLAEGVASLLEAVTGEEVRRCALAITTDHHHMPALHHFLRYLGDPTRHKNHHQLIPVTIFTLPLRHQVSGSTIPVTQQPLSSLISLCL